MRKRKIQTVLLITTSIFAYLGLSAYYLIPPPWETHLLARIYYICALFLLLTFIVYSLLSEDKNHNNEKNVDQEVLFWICFCIFVILVIIIVAMHLYTFFFRLNRQLI